MLNFFGSNLEIAGQVFILSRPEFPPHGKGDVPEAGAASRKKQLVFRLLNQAFSVPPACLPPLPHTFLQNNS
jgi:hypothetical protein